MTDIIKFSKPQQELLTQKLQHYFARELNYDLGGFDAQFLLDFIAEEIGYHFYNQGLLDAQVVLSKQVDDIQMQLGN